MAQPLAELTNWTQASLLAGPIAAGEPFVLRGAVSAWPVVAQAQRGDDALLAYLRGFASETPVDFVAAPPIEHGRMHYDTSLRGFNFIRDRAPLADFLDQLARTTTLDPAPALAAQGIPADHAAPGFTKLNRIGWLPPSAQARLWIGNLIEVAIHSDPADNIACVAAGRRRFTLFPPECLPNLAMGPFDPTPAGTPISMADPLNPNLEKYPRFKAALDAALQAQLEPGDLVFIPYGWYHHVQSLDPVSMLVNHWWNEAPQDGGSPWDAMLHAIMSVRHLPAPQRRAWLAMFRHYAFLCDGDPAAHLPAYAAGILAANGPADRMAMRRLLIKNLAGAR
jgi:Cupin-like domain